MSDVPSENDHQYIPTDKRKKPTTITRIIVAALALFVLLALIDWRYVNEHSERIRFITVNSLSLFVVVIIAIQAVIYRREWRLMQRGLEQTDKVIEKMQAQLEAINKQEGHLSVQAEAAKEAADMAKGQLVAMQHQEQAQFAQLEAIKEQAKTMDRQLVLGTRAYLGVHSISFDGAKKRIFLHVENIGKVPAKDIQVVVEIRAEVPETKYLAFCRNSPQHDWAKKGDERHIQIPFMFPFGRTKLFPGSLKIPVMIRLDESAYFSEDQIGLITSGYAKLRVQGFILYSDGFHSGKKTEFAFRYFLKDNLWVPQPSEGFGHFQTDPEKPDSDYNPN